MSQVLQLTRDLIGFDTTNPPGREAACAGFLAARLEAAGFSLVLQTFDTDRTNLVATWRGEDAEAAPLVMTGHIDTVPLGGAPWSFDPFAGETGDGRIYGRGASDMKAGVAAMVVAAERLAACRAGLRRGLTLIFTSGEETGCVGAQRLFGEGGPDLGRASALLVGEPTGNRVATGHKGCLALHGRATGVTAHSSMPGQGVNAVYRAARAIGRVETYRFDTPSDPLLGDPTINVGMVQGGMNYNSVPDAATFTLDVRTTSAMSHAVVEADLRRALGDEVALERFVDMPPVGTSEDDSFVRHARAAVARVLGSATDPTPLGLPFFSDASVLAPRLGCPTVILGPGEAAMAHQTDEYCRIDRLEEAVEIYGAIIADWCG